MSELNIKYDVLTFPTSDEFRVVRVVNDYIMVVFSPETYDIDSGEVDRMDMVFEDPITAEIICDFLNEEL